MSAPVNTKCPHCRVDIKVERPDEPRSAPCPSCDGTILIPDNLYPRGWAPGRVKRNREYLAATTIPAAQPLPATNLPNEMRQISIKLLVTFGVLLVASGTLFGGLLGVLSRPGNVHQETAAEPGEGDVHNSERPALKPGIERIEVRRNALRSEINRIQREIAKVDEAILRVLNTSQVDLDTVIDGMKGNTR